MQSRRGQDNRPRRDFLCRPDLGGLGIRPPDTLDDQLRSLHACATDADAAVDPGATQYRPQVIRIFNADNLTGRHVRPDTHTDARRECRPAEFGVSIDEKSRCWRLL